MSYFKAVETQFLTLLALCSKPGSYLPSDMTTSYLFPRVVRTQLTSRTCKALAHGNYSHAHTLAMGVSKWLYTELHLI